MIWIMKSPVYRNVAHSAQLQMKLTPDLKIAIERAAAAQGKTISDWIRDLAIDAIERADRANGSRS